MSRQNWTIRRRTEQGETVALDICNNGVTIGAATIRPGIDYEANAALMSAAPQLLLALRAFEQGLTDGTIRFTKPRQSDSDLYHPANTLMCAAFAKVEDRE